MTASSRHAALRTASPAIALAGAVLLTACRTNPPTTSAPVSTPARQTGDTLCASPGAVIGLQISEQSRQNGRQQPAGQTPGPVSVASAAEARTIARTVCELPPIPATQQHCPALAQGTVLLLTFRTRLGVLPVVTIQTTGCSSVTGAGPVRWAGTKPTLAQGLHAIVHHEPPVIFAN
jgi:hypothetical protein